MSKRNDMKYTKDDIAKDVKEAFDELESVQVKYDYSKLPKKPQEEHMLNGKQICKIGWLKKLNIDKLLKLVLYIFYTDHKPFIGEVYY